MDRLVRFRLSRRVFYDNPMFPLWFVRVGGRERGRVWTKWGSTHCTSPFTFKRCAKTELSKAHFRDVFPTIYNECRNTRETLCLINSSSEPLEHNRRVVLPCRGLARGCPQFSAHQHNSHSTLGAHAGLSEDAQISILLTSSF